MKIKIEYLRRDEVRPRSLALSPEEYFGPPDQGETLSVDSVPKYQAAYEYTAHSADELQWTVLEVLDGEESWRVRTQFLDGIRSLMIHSHKSDGAEEIIHQTEMCPGCWHTLRTLKEPQKDWALVLNDITTEGNGRLLADRHYCGILSFEQMRAFGSIAGPSADADQG